MAMYKGTKRGRPRKNGRSLNVILSPDVFAKLCDHCDTVGQTKTAAVERAITMYCNYYKQKLGSGDAENEECK